MSTDTSHRWRRGLQSGTLVGQLCVSTRAAAFWLAIALPLAYLPGVALVPSLFADPSVIVLAVAGNLLALVVGYRYEPLKGCLDSS